MQSKLSTKPGALQKRVYFSYLSRKTILLKTSLKFYVEAVTLTNFKSFFFHFNEMKENSLTIVSAAFFLFTCLYKICDLYSYFPPSLSKS